MIGLVGMTVCWLASYFALPAFVVFFEKKGWMSVATEARESKGLVAKLAPLAVRYHRWLAAGTVVLSLVSLLGATQLSKRTIESGIFSKLRNKESMEHGSGFWGKKTDLIFGRGLTPTIVLTQSAEETAKVLEQLKLIQAREKEKTPFLTPFP